MKPDLCDLLIIAGLALIGVGMWMVAPWASLLTLGVVILALGLLGSVSKSRAPAAGPASAKESHGNSKRNS